MYVCLLLSCHFAVISDVKLHMQVLKITSAGQFNITLYSACAFEIFILPICGFSLSSCCVAMSVHCALCCYSQGVVTADSVGRPSIFDTTSTVGEISV